MLLLISMSESQESRDEKMRSVDSVLASNISYSILIILMSRPWQPGVARDEAGRCDVMPSWCDTVTPAVMSLTRLPGPGISFQWSRIPSIVAILTSLVINNNCDDKINVRQ